jgi:hypothetical protein
MIARGDLPPVDCAIFADTGWEPKAVYEWLTWLETQLPYPVYRVSQGNLRDDLIERSTSDSKRFASVPFFTLSQKGKKGMLPRQCTKEYKIRPLQRKVVELMGGNRPKNGCEMLIGISMDEVIRMRPSRVQYIKNAYPLIEAGMTRQDCLRWMADRQYPKPGKSSCIGCPYHSDREWRALAPAEFQDAVEIDRVIRSRPNFKDEQYLHRSLKPLDQVDLSTAEERGQINMFNNECEGMCGV